MGPRAFDEPRRNPSVTLELSGDSRRARGRARDEAQQLPAGVGDVGRI